jgi:hypothetical protein
MAPGGAATLWIVNYQELFEYPTASTFQRFVDAGLWPNLLNRLEASGRNGLVFLAVVGQIFLAPLMLRGLWKWRDRRIIMPTLFYMLLLYGVMSWVFPLQGMRGSWPHSVTGLLPALWGVAAAQAGEMARWLVRRRGGRFQEAHQFVTVGMLMIAAIATGFFWGRDLIGFDDPTRLKWNQPGDQFRTINAELDALGVPQDATIMSGNPLAMYTHGGRPNIPNPVNAEAIILLSERYDVHAVVLSDNLFDEIDGLREGVEDEPRLQLAAEFISGTSEENFTYIYIVLPR